MSEPATAPYLKPLEDLLEHLPCSYVEAYQKNRIIFDPEHPTNCLYLVISGTVANFRISESGEQVLIDIYTTDDFFCESAVLGVPHLDAKAVTLEGTKVMTWTAVQLEALMAARPKLGLAFLQSLIARHMALGERLKSFSSEQIAHRVGRALLYFSEKLGTPQPDGSAIMPAVKHALLADYVGTSREIVTTYLNQLRRSGYIHYSRKSMMIFPEALKHWIQESHEPFMAPSTQGSSSSGA